MSDLTREELLACDSVEALFGGSAGEARSLKRAYAKLAKRFRSDEDPEAFQHLRRLYEQARSSSFEVVSSHPQQEETPPLDQVQSALAQRDLQRLFDLVLAHRAQLLVDDPGLLQRSVRELIVWGGPDLAPDALDMVEAIVSDPRWELPDGLVTSWEIDVAHLRALHAASSDPGACAALVAGVSRLWKEPPDRAVRLWLETAGAIPERDRESAMTQMERHHPGVFSLVTRAEFEMVMPLLRSGPVDSDRTRELDDAYPPSPERGSVFWHGVHGVAREPVTPIVLMVVVVCVIVALTFTYLPARVGNALYWIGLVIFFRVGRAIVVRSQQRILRWIERMARRTLPAEDEVGLKRLLQVCRTEGLFPRELALAIAANPPPTYLSEKLAYEPGHPALELERRASGVIETLTEVHARRVEDAVAREREA